MPTLSVTLIIINFNLEVILIDLRREVLYYQITCLVMKSNEDIMFLLQEQFNIELSKKL